MAIMPISDPAAGRSPRTVVPSARATIGIRKVTSDVLLGPTLAISRNQTTKAAAVLRTASARSPASD
jgi:hypothetical protein